MKTYKKMKVIGNIDYVNTTTGEVESIQKIEMKSQDFNFDKIWLIHILDSLEAVGNQKIKVMNELIKLKNTDNLIITTHEKICKKTGVSRPIVSQTLQILIESNFLKVVQKGVYQINPDTLFKGGNSNRMRVLLEYQKQEEIKISDNPETHVLLNKNISDETQEEIQLD